MSKQALRFRIVSLITGVAILTFSGWAGADPPGRVARLGYMSGAVSFSPAGENDWDRAAINRPLTSGDRLWTDAGARAEIQIGGALVRMNAATGAAILNLDDRIAQLQLTQGTLNVRVRRLDAGQMFEVDTPNLAFTLRQAGEYRISVDPDADATTIVVRQGRGEVFGEGAAYTIDNRQAYRFAGSGLRDYQYVDAPRPDEFDRWASARDRRYDSSSSARYVSPDVIGYQDLDDNGSWRDDADYGKVWFPNHVAAEWAPYSDGQWAWVDPWGWTWVDAAPWGFAVSHYGRWAHVHGSWGWVPGPPRSRAYYAPALVAFIGGSNFELSISSGRVGGIAWFPLAPREVYRPAYQVSRGYFENINRSNTVINTTVINNTYINKTSKVVYANRQVPGAIVAVPTTTFVQSQPVGRAAQRMPRERIAGAAVAAAPTVAPTEKSVRGSGEAGGKPPSRVFERPVIAHSAPPAAHPGFAAQQQGLAAQPGKPLDEAARKELKPAAAVPASVVKLVAPTQDARATAPPPAPAANGAGAGEARPKPDARPAAAPGAATPNSAARPVAPAAPAAESSRGPTEQQSRQRGQAAAPTQVSPPQSAPPPVPAESARKTSVAPPASEAKPPQAPVAPAPAAAAPAREPRGKPEQHGAPVAAPPAPGAAEPRSVAPAPAAAPAASPAPEVRARPERPVPPPPAQRAPEPKIAAPQATPAAPVPAAPPAPAVTPMRPPPASRPVEPHPPVVAPPAPPPQAPPAAPVRPEPAANNRPTAAPAAPPAPPPQAAPHRQEPRPEAGKSDERGGDKQKRDEENRKQEK